MNFFCRIFGHTWVHATERQTIRWRNDEKTLAQLHPAGPDREPEFQRACVRCGERREWVAPNRPDGSPTQAVSGGR
ncbi:MAG: hypothetical protein QF410_15665 [Planctomycetota bacterium]|jgi:hypothetical protein|nr:hypothetical protein [Planctomycetota bacterium]MDP6408254.1 hypothetical protein [Planctomycetota bacterium]MDP6540983.1 hypothetical protein [Planctomycetota bacterium]